MKKIIFLAILTISTLASIAKEEGDKKNSTTKMVSLKVVDTNNEAIAGAEIFVESLGISTYTDMEGNSTFEISSVSNTEIKVSFISYQDKVLDISKINDGRIILIEE